MKTFFLPVYLGSKREKERKRGRERKREREKERERERERERCILANALLNCALLTKQKVYKRR